MQDMHGPSDGCGVCLFVNVCFVLFLWIFGAMEMVGLHLGLLHVRSDESWSCVCKPTDIVL